MEGRKIRLLDPTPQGRGDLFARLVSGVFLALGYDDLRYEIQKTGREVDLQGRHRTENRRFVAECKAEKKPIGGDDINKFVGVLDVERRRDPTPCVGYFLSLSGFKETAREQEKEAGGERVILLGEDRIVEELVRGRLVPSPEDAAEQAGRAAAAGPEGLQMEIGLGLLGHVQGWIWLVYFTRDGERTHFALVHADGHSLAESLAERIVEVDRALGGDLHSLTYLGPPDRETPEDVRQAYFAYLAAECGSIELATGLPADQEVGSRRPALERLFVSLHLERVGPDTTPSSQMEAGSLPSPSGTRGRRETTGAVLSRAARLAVLAPPGGGKSTLLKRLALAYAFPERRAEVADELPERGWFPLFLRCRQLGELVREPIIRVLDSIAGRAEMPGGTEAFRTLVQDAFRRGDALLLIDGLDEIASEGDRRAFVLQLRTLLALYPAARMVLTSREPGFRSVATALAGECEVYRIAELDQADIRRLTVAWHREVAGDRPEVLRQAEELADLISRTDRVRRLATSPLLLTTLLLVKRWVGQLPTRRSVLYEKALEVLLMTWNTEAWTPIEREEAIPQLAFVAFAMMTEGVQRIPAGRLTELLNQARHEMPEILHHASLSVDDFIRRVELRSSLLVQVGQEETDGRLQPVYEFRHLTFQEYLAAVAVTDGYYSGRRDEDDLFTVLEPHLDAREWEEVVPLAAVLAGRRAGPLVEKTLRLAEKKAAFRGARGLPDHIARCVADEARLSPELVERSLGFLAHRVIFGPPQDASDGLLSLIQSKNGPRFREILEQDFVAGTGDLSILGGNLLSVALLSLGAAPPEPNYRSLQSLLTSGTLIDRCLGALMVMHLAYSDYRERPPYPALGEVDARAFEALGDRLVPLVGSENVAEHFAASWALAWLGTRRTWSPVRSLGVLQRLFDLWTGSENEQFQKIAAWALGSLPLVDRASRPLAQPSPAVEATLRRLASEVSLYAGAGGKTKAGLVASSYYLGIPWTDEELVDYVKLVFPASDYRDHAESILRGLGRPPRRPPGAGEP